MPEVYFPNSKIPFRPLNAHGRAMPKPVRPSKPDLYQVIVRRRGEQIPFGPKIEKAAAEQFCLAIETGIRVGVEKELSDPHVVRVF
jgi:hypothetical protein